MWKVFLVISAFVLAGATYLAWDNKGTMAKTLADVEKGKGIQVDRETLLKKEEDQVLALNESAKKFSDEAETLTTAKIDLDAKVIEAKSNLKMIQSKMATAEENLKKSEETANDIDGVKAIQQEMLQLQTQIEEAEIDIVQKEGAAAAAKVDADRLAKVAEELGSLRADQDSGLIRGDFQSNVKRAFNKWGFVVINGGNDQGVVNRAQLDVYRRGQPICKLLVVSVEPSEAVADIIPGSLAAGQTVQSGDVVVKTIRGAVAVTPKPAAIAPPAGGTTTPAVPGSPATAPAVPTAPKAADPFGGDGGGMAPPAAPAKTTEPDPFGNAPATDKPKPAEPDPFKQ